MEDTSTATTNNLSSTPAATAPWHAKYPAPRLKGVEVTREELLSWHRNEKESLHKSFLLVDLRRSDHEGGAIQSSLNLPAQSLYASIPTLYNLVEAAGVSKVVFFCGASQGRGPRAAGWFQDYIAAVIKGKENLKEGNSSATSTMTSYVLVGGIKGWANAGEEYTNLMNEYDAKVWMAEEKTKQ